MKGPFEKHEKEPDGGSFVLLTRFPERWQADLAVSLLASEGIEAWSADELLDGFGVIVSESDAMAAQGILQMAERGELAITDDHQSISGGGSPHRVEYPEKSQRYEDVDTFNSQPLTRNSTALRCPRCGSENIEKRRRVRALFIPGYRCRVCRWEWK